MATTYENAHDLLKKGYALYEKKFNAKPQWAGCAPGRVNLIGEHVDYNDGYVLPMVRLQVLGSFCLSGRRSQCVTIW